MKFKVLLFVISVVLAGCSIEKKATKAFKLGKYQSAIDLNKKILAGNAANGRANYFIAESYRLSNRIKEAEPFYAKAGGRGIDKDSIQFFYSQSLKANGKYSEAKAQLEELNSRTTVAALKDRV